MSAPAAAILAGGLARRFGGVPKGLELVCDTRIVDRVVAAVRGLADEIVLVGAAPAVAATLPGLAVVADESPGAGPLGGIVSALEATGRDTLVIAWDMPWVEAKHLRPLLDVGGEADVVAWEVDGWVEPLCALYRSSAIAPLRDAFTKGERSPREALRRLRVHLLRGDGSAEPHPFMSVNTPQQLEAARRISATAES